MISSDERPDAASQPVPARTPSAEMKTGAWTVGLLMALWLGSESVTPFSVMRLDLSWTVPWLAASRVPM